MFKSMLFGCLVLLAVSAVHADQAAPSQSPAATSAPPIQLARIGLPDSFAKSKKRRAEYVSA